MRIFLTGFMGSGKTTIGPALASRLGYKFVDQDLLIEQHYKLPVGEVFAKFGEAKFRETEHKVLTEIVTADNFVLSTGGGAPCFFNNMDFMDRYGITVYLKAGPISLMQRLKGSIDSRPLLKGKTEQELLQYITDKLTERELFYNKAKLCIATDTLGPEEVIEKIIDLGLSLPAQFIGARLKPNKNK